VHPEVAMSDVKGSPQLTSDEAKFQESGYSGSNLRLLKG
jgi:hypothetical protein